MTASSDGVRFGPAGWSYPDWKRPIYAGREKGGLELLSTVFDTVEVNSTFYRPTSPAFARSWVRKVSANPAFRFTAKLWQGFTHGSDLLASDLAAYLAGIAPLAEEGRLGALLAQFPWSFKNDETNRRHLERLLAAFRGWPLVIEVRHSSWNRTEVLETLRRESVGFCNVDQPRFRDSLPPTALLTCDTGYVRLHGRNARDWFRAGAGRDERYHYRYSRAELAPWAGSVRELAQDARRVFVVTNNHFRGNAVADAVVLRHLVDGETREVPAGWIQAFPDLAAVARPRPDPRPGLFGPS